MQSRTKAEVPENMLRLLNEYGVPVEQLDADTARFLAVPVAEHFSKARTNLLIRRSLVPPGAAVFVDADLAYYGRDSSLHDTWQGPVVRSWRELKLTRMDGSLADVLARVLHLLGSPLAERARICAGVGPLATPVQSPDLGNSLSAAGEIMAPEALAAAYASSFRPDLAQTIALVPQRPTVPSSALLWGPSGSGRDQLMLAAAHAALQSRRFKQVLRIVAARIVAGAIFPGEMDGALMRLLDDALGQHDTLFLFQDLDVCLTGSSVCFSLLCSALDRGLRCLATARYESSMTRLKADEGVFRRFVGIRVEPPTRAELAVALEHLAKSSAVAVAPAAIQTAVKLASLQPGSEPAAAIGLLAGAMPEAARSGNSQVGPDDVAAVQRNDWPTCAGQE